MAEDFPTGVQSGDVYRGTHSGFRVALCIDTVALRSDTVALHSDKVALHIDIVALQ